MPQHPAPESSPRAFDFADLGRPRPKAPPSVRAVPAPPEPSELELEADDILESDDLEPLEAAAAEVVTGFEVPLDGDCEVAPVEAFDAVEVEGLAEHHGPLPEPAKAAVISRSAFADFEESEVAPAEVEEPTLADPPVASLQLDYRAPSPSTLIGMAAPQIPPAPTTSPLPLAEAEGALAEAEGAAAADRTLEFRRDDVARAAAAASALPEEQPAQQQQFTEVLRRADMPAALQGAPARSGSSSALLATAPAWQGDPSTRAAMSSTAPVALDVAAAPRLAVPQIPAPANLPSFAPAFQGRAAAKGGLSGAAIGGLVAAAVVLVGLVGAGGFAASRALSAKADAVAPAVERAPETPAATAGTVGAGSLAPAAVPEPPAAPANAAAPVAPAAAEPAALDVSSLPSAASPRPAAAAGLAAAPSPATPPAPRVAAAPPAPSSPSGIKTTALPPPGAAPATPAPAAAAPPPRGGSNPLPPPAAPPVATAPAAAAPTGTGTVRVDPSLRAVVVDGGYRRANDGVLILSCGPHRIKAGMKELQTVNVPCGGSVSL